MNTKKMIFGFLLLVWSSAAVKKIKKKTPKIRNLGNRLLSDLKLAWATMRWVSLDETFISM